MEVLHLVPHGVGEKWAQAFWYAQGRLEDEHGFDADVYDFTGTATLARTAPRLEYDLAIPAHHIDLQYGAMALFLFYYLWFLGRHSLALSLLMSIGMPIGFFFFFEGVMRITLPKGMSFTDPVFNVLYEIIY